MELVGDHDSFPPNPLLTALQLLQRGVHDEQGRSRRSMVPPVPRRRAGQVQLQSLPAVVREKIGQPGGLPRTSRVRVEARGHIGYNPDRAVEASGRRSTFDRAVSEAERGSCEPAAVGTLVRREGDRPSRGNIEGMCRPFPFEPYMPLMIAARSGLPDLYRDNLALQPSRPS